jgi:hypothetical protein
MIEKTLQTFHPSNMVLQQQYRNNKYMKYCELVNILLGAEAQNELLMQNYQKRPVALRPYQKHMQTSRLRGREAPLEEGVVGAAIISGRQRELLRSSHRMAAAVAATMVVAEAEAKAKATPSRGDASASKHAGEGCFRCGSQQHWSRTCTTEKYLIDIYQEWKKHQNSEAHFIQAPVDATSGEHLELPEPAA